MIKLNTVRHSRPRRTVYGINLKTTEPKNIQDYPAKALQARTYDILIFKHHLER